MNALVTFLVTFAVVMFWVSPIVWVVFHHFRADKRQNDEIIQMLKEIRDNLRKP